MNPFLNFLAIFLLLIGSFNVNAYSGGIVDRSGMNSTTCAGCHGGGSLGTTTSILDTNNAAPAASVTALSINNLKVRVATTGTGSAGFNLAVSAGSVSTSDSTAQELANASRIEITHNGKKPLSGNMAEWSFVWAAPATPGAATLYVCGNGVNNNNAPTSDTPHCATTTITVVANTPPVANAGTDQTVNEQTTVNLSGSTSSDSDGTISSYSWSQTSGTAVTLSSNTAANPSFTSPTLTSQTTLVFQLTVTDDGGTTDTDSVSITVNPVNATPTANAGNDQTVNEQTLVNLSGSGSDDGSITGYAWTQISGPAVILNNSNIATPNFSAPTLTSQQIIVLTLTVTDNESATDTDTISIIVNPVNAAPLVDAGQNQSAVSSDNVVLNASASDSDGSVASRTWSQDSGPAISFSNATVLNPTFTAPTVISQEIIVLRLTVTDNEGGSNSDTVQIFVNAAASNPLPTANAGIDQVVNEQTSVQLNGSGTDTASGSITGYSWVHISGPNITFSNSNIANPTFTTPTVLQANSPTSITLRLTVTDNDGGTNSDDVVITVNAVNTPPTANAGNDQFVNEFALVNLNGATSSDSDGSISSYAWSRISGPAISLSNSSIASPMFTAPDISVASTLVLRLTVTDNEGVSTSDEISISIALDNDADGTTDNNDADDDNDGMPDSYESAHGLNPLVNDATLDADADGFNNLYEYQNNTNPQVENNPPVVTAPTDITITSTGYLTAITLGNALANDAQDGTLTATPDRTGPFRPGSYTITWSATDAASNIGTATQQVNIIPLADFTVDQMAGEGSMIQIQVTLNGDAATYPVLIPYTVSGTASNPDDHNAINGVINIANGTTGNSALFTINTGISGESNETIIFTMGTLTNAAPGTHNIHTVTVSDNNITPQIQLTVSQGVNNGVNIFNNNGNVTILANITDANPTDTHSYNWAASSNALIPINNSATSSNPNFEFNLLNMSGGYYRVVLTVTDNGNPATSTTANLLINIQTTEPALDNSDTDNDGTADSIEGISDENNNGIVDYLDAAPADNFLPASPNPASQIFVETESSLQLRLGTTALAAYAHNATISEADLENHGGISAEPTSNANDTYTVSGGTFDFIITGLRQTGDSVYVVLPLQAAIPANAKYRKYSPANGWNDFVVDNNNKIFSASSNNGSCPAPGHASYAAGLIRGFNCVELLIEDGGPNDIDALVNYSISGTGGVATLANTATPDSGGGAMTPTWLMIFIAMFMWRFCYIRENRKINFFNSHTK